VQLHRAPGLAVQLSRLRVAALADAAAAQAAPVRAQAPAADRHPGADILSPKNTKQNFSNIFENFKILKIENLYLKVFPVNHGRNWFIKLTPDQLRAFALRPFPARIGRGLARRRLSQRLQPEEPGVRQQAW
jgi:hypothetical protein